MRNEQSSSCEDAIAGRLSLRPPQRRSVEILDRVTEIVPPTKDTDLSAAINIIASEFPSVEDFEREFPSLCFALATGVGKTRLMGAFIVAYLKLAHSIDNFFVLAPNLTIYNKLIADFTPNTPKYVFKGISEFAISPPIAYDRRRKLRAPDRLRRAALPKHDQHFQHRQNLLGGAWRPFAAHSLLSRGNRRELLRLSGGPPRS